MKYFFIMVICLFSLCIKAEDHDFGVNVDLISNSKNYKSVGLKYGIENKKNYIYWKMNNSTINNEYNFKLGLKSKFTIEIDNKSGFILLNSFDLDSQRSTVFKGITFESIEGQYFYKMNELSISLKLGEEIYDGELEGLSKFHLASVSTGNKYFKLTSKIKKAIKDNDEQSELFNKVSLEYEFSNYGVLIEYEISTGGIHNNEKTSIITYMDFSSNFHSELSLEKSHDFITHDTSTNTCISLSYNF